MASDHFEPSRRATRAASAGAAGRGRMQRLGLRLPAVCAALAACLGASSQSCSFSSSGDGDDRPSFVTQLSLQNSAGEVSDSFSRGAPVTLVLTVRNRLNSTAEVEFPTSRTFDFVIVRENTDDVVWQWSEGLNFSPVVTTMEFLPGETKTFTQVWNQIDAAGEQLRRGRYEARGVLVYSDFDTRPLRTNPLGSSLQRFAIE